MKPALLALPFLAAALAGGCCTTLPRGAGDVLAADRAFAAMAVSEGPQAAYRLFADPKSIRIPPAGPIVTGRDGLVAELEGLGKGDLVWTPRGGSESAAGDLGWTWGEFRAATPKGPQTGRYLTVWRKTPDGWRIAADIGTAP